MNNTKWSNGFYIQFRQSFANSTVCLQCEWLMWIIFNTLYNSKGNFFWKIYVYPDTYQRMNTLMNGLNTNSVAHFLFISYNFEIVKMRIFLNIYSAIYGELFQTQLSLLLILNIAKVLEQYILERVGGGEGTFHLPLNPSHEYIREGGGMGGDISAAP